MYMSTICYTRNNNCTDAKHKKSLKHIQLFYYTPTKQYRNLYVYIYRHFFELFYMQMI
jgi:hypothetical protein